jgi:hypothetical protein
MSNFFAYRDDEYGYVYEEDGIEFLTPDITEVFGHSTNASGDRGVAWSLHNAVEEVLKTYTERYGQPYQFDVSVEQLTEAMVNNGPDIRLVDWMEVHPDANEEVVSFTNLSAVMVGDQQVGHTITPTDIVIQFLEHTRERRDQLDAEFEQNHPRGDMPLFDYNEAKADYTNARLKEEFGHIHNRDDIGKLERTVSEFAHKLIENNRQLQQQAELNHDAHIVHERLAEQRRSVAEFHEKHRKHIEEMQKKVDALKAEREQRRAQERQKIERERERLRARSEWLEKEIEKRRTKKTISPIQRMKVEKFRESDQGKKLYRQTVARTAWALCRAQQIADIENGRPVSKKRPSKQDYEIAKQAVDRTANVTTSEIKYNKVPSRLFEAAMKEWGLEYSRSYTLATKDLQKVNAGDERARNAIEKPEIRAERMKAEQRTRNDNQQVQKKQEEKTQEQADRTKKRNKDEPEL